MTVNRTSRVRRAQRRRRRAARPATGASRPRTADVRSIWRAQLAAVSAPHPNDLERLAELSADWTEREIATSIGLAIAFQLLNRHELDDQALLEELVLRDNHPDEPDPVHQTVLRHAAIHEAGHAVWAAHAWHIDAVRALALIGPPGTLGQTLLDPAVFALRKDRQQRRRLVGMALAGAVAESLAFGPDHPSIGSEHDIERAEALLAERGQPRGERGPQAMAARWAEVSTVLTEHRLVVLRVAAQLAAEPHIALMSSALRRLLSQINGAASAWDDSSVESQSKKPLLASA